ncbi:MAG: hypothetical protein MZW92_12150 [Comamonadaceae bacterium]|nr:hypothetical protein [Comamonadaceae bacterium]
MHELRLDRGADRPRREAGLQRALRAAQAPRREVRDRARGAGVPVSQLPAPLAIR